MKPLISVIVPAYNIENYIERSLKSICKQTYENLEIIVVNDGSIDRTGEIIDRMAELDGRIFPIHKKNAGVSAARNTGLDKATGDYIGFVDGDDIIDEDMYEFLLNNALKYGADISHCGYKMVFPNRIDYYYNTGEVRVQDNDQGIYDLIKADRVEPGLCNKLYKKNIVGNKRLNESIRINEDVLFNYYLFKDAKKSIFEDVPRYHYMVRKNSAATSKVNINKLQDPLAVVHEMMNQETGEVYSLLEKRYLYLLEKLCTRNDMQGCNELTNYQKEKRIELKKLLQRNNLTATYSKKEKFQLKLAVTSPMLYRILNEVYARITGSKNRYKV